MRFADIVPPRGCEQRFPRDSVWLLFQLFLKFISSTCDIGEMLRQQQGRFARMVVVHAARHSVLIVRRGTWFGLVLRITRPANCFVIAAGLHMEQ